MKVVGLVGPKRSGKSTAAEALVKHRGFVSIGFADALKDLALRVNPDLDFYGEYSSLNWMVEHHGWEICKGYPEVRRFLQELGTGVRDIDPGFWVREWNRRTAEAGAQGLNVVVPDVRFANEAKMLRLFSRNLLIRIIRPGLDLSDRHISETELNEVECDLEIVNDGTERWLHGEILNVVDTRLIP